MIATYKQACSLSLSLSRVCVVQCHAESTRVPLRPQQQRAQVGDGRQRPQDGRVYADAHTRTRAPHGRVNLLHVRVPRDSKRKSSRAVSYTRCLSCSCSCSLSSVPHDSLEFTELEHLFACVMIGEGEILGTYDRVSFVCVRVACIISLAAYPPSNQGFRFTKEEDEIMFLDTLVELFNMALQLASRRLRNQRKKRSPCPLFCFNFMTGNRSVCFVTARLQFPIVQRLASAVVPALLSNIAVGTQFIEALVSELNALDLSGPNPTSFRFSRIKDSIELPPPPQASLGLYGPVRAAIVAACRLRAHDSLTSFIHSVATLSAIDHGLWRGRGGVDLQRRVGRDACGARGLRGRQGQLVGRGDLMPPCAADARRPRTRPSPHVPLHIA